MEGNLLTTIKDIAKKADVSVATVSYVINNTRPVHPDKKKRILQAIEELNYVPNATARGLRAKKNQTIGLVISDIMNPFYPDLAKGCQDVAKDNGYTLMLYNTEDQVDQLIGVIKQVREGKIDGLILASLLNSDKELIKGLLETPYPIVLAHRKLDNINVDSVVADNFTGAYTATEHLAALGHKRIALIDGVNESPVSVERKNGYLKAMETESLSKWVVNGKGKYQASYTNAYKLLQLPVEQRPTAIFATSDLMALGVIDAAKDLNLSVPKDVAVMGYDDLFIAASRSIELSTVRVPRYEIGKQAAQLLLNKMKNGTDFTSSKAKNIILQTNLVVRKTS